jgi:hypothetical protein
MTALNDYRLLPCSGLTRVWEKLANGRMRALWLANEEPSPALSGTLSHAAHGRGRLLETPSLVSPILSSRRKPRPICPRNECPELRALTQVWVSAFAGMTEINCSISRAAEELNRIAS